ncbi:hypothetical protein DFH06DRAFT_1154038 [Mycena polygramma]|nr:hypothetical protein DFH06DRAFT_1154038 [Mycena polygramma]
MARVHEPAAAPESLAGSVAAAALSASATPAQREAALQYFAALAIGSPAAAPARLSSAHPVLSEVAPAKPAVDKFSPVATPGAPGPPPPPPPAPTTANLPVGPFYAGVLYPYVPTSHLTDIGVRDNGDPWYAVLKGSSVGLTQNNAAALQAVVGVSRNAMKAYKSLAMALFSFNHALDLDLIEIRPF